MTAEQRQGLLAKEQSAFDQLLPVMLAEHPNEFVVFHGGHPKGYFPSYDGAYAFALDNFGLDAIVLVAQVKERSSAPASISWYAGAMFG